MNVLAFETAGPLIGVSLYTGGKAHVMMERIQRGADAKLIPWAVLLAEKAGIALSELDGVAVSFGPGGFTGLRVGMATAAGLAQSLNIPVWGNSSLHHRAMRVDSDRTLSMLDARKSRVYACLYGRGGQVLHGPGDVPPEEAVAWAGGHGVVATGEGSLVYADLLGQAGIPIAAEADSPAVDTLARLGAEAIEAGSGEDALSVRPKYLRAPDAKKSKDR
jgi:tRNA threonylcarbamoyladenosine biosynthesis protein TsaB